MKCLRMSVMFSVMFVCSTIVVAKSPESRIEYNKKSASENTSNASKKEKVHENTRTSLNKLKGDIKKKK